MHITLETPEILTIIGGLFLLITAVVQLTRHSTRESARQAALEQTVSRLLTWSEDAKRMLMQTSANVNQLTDSVKHLTDLFENEVFQKPTTRRKNTPNGH